MFTSAEITRELAGSLPDRHSELYAAYPELDALLVRDAIQALGEHENNGEFPLLDHSIRALTILSHIENDAPPLFPGDPNAIPELSKRWSGLDETWRESIRIALLFMDVAKGGNARQRRAWATDGIDTSIHNFGSAAIAEAAGVPARALPLIRWHGTMGQFVRGEVPSSEFRKCLNDATPGFLDAFLIVNVCDTAAVRNGLMDGRLFEMFMDADRLLRSDDSQTYSDETRAVRFANLRRSCGDADDASQVFLRSLDRLGSDRHRFCALFDAVNFWYCESALAGLSPRGQLGAIAYALGVADRSNNVTIDDGFHVSFHRLAEQLDGATPTGRYRQRLLETVVCQSSLQEVFVEGLSADVLVDIEVQIGQEAAISVGLNENEEAKALVTLLAIYEQKSSAKFHTILKTLCDLYGLRKDTFDRVANEREYLKHMNSARSDKSRMLDYAVGETIVEVGPGGGVVLDLISARFPSARVIGLDVSQEVVDALNERRSRTGATWEVVFGDAYELPTVIPGGFDTVIYCSVLHEIYSYVERDGERFRLESVIDLLQASFDGLRPGGRIIIRDGIAPPPAPRVVRFLDPEGPEFLTLFAQQFEGREIRVEWIDERTARMGSQDTMEFLYCYTWGPASFPYEVREQYGVLEYDAYVDAILTSLPASAAIVPIEPDLASYLQPGYRDGLASKVVLMDGEMNPVELPDSNCLIVIEKRS